jgi:hypothetical protein
MAYWLIRTLRILLLRLISMGRVAGPAHQGGPDNHQKKETGDLHLGSPRTE